MKFLLALSNMQCMYVCVVMIFPRSAAYVNPYDEWLL